MFVFYMYLFFTGAKSCYTALFYKFWTRLHRILNNELSTYFSIRFLIAIFYGQLYFKYICIYLLLHFKLYFKRNTSFGMHFYTSNLGISYNTTWTVSRKVNYFGLSTSLAEPKFVPTYIICVAFILYKYIIEQWIQIKRM